ncbi:MAG: NGG1p interacting factor NIF3 [Spirochaetales bacterium]|nr:NGG1p interacting factor NIF3 [Spirochaetales bacterium]
MYKIGVYVPESHLEPVKEAMFANGAGKYGKYDRCSWQVIGTGQFRPSAGARPYVGTPGELEIVREYRIEMVCEKAVIARVIEAMLAAHPYEEPAYDIVDIKMYKDL